MALVRDLCDHHDLVDKTVGPTRVATTQRKNGTTTTTSTKIDLLLCSPSSRYSNVPAGNVPYSDHRLARTESTYRCPVPEHRIITTRLWRKSAEERFVSEVSQFSQSIHHSLQSTTQPINQSTNHFVKGLLDMVDCHFPLRRRRVKQSEEPWMTGEVKALFRQRDAAYLHLCGAKGTPQYEVRRAAFLSVKRRAATALRHARSRFFANNAGNSRLL